MPDQAQLRSVLPGSRAGLGPDATNGSDRNGRASPSLARGGRLSPAMAPTGSWAAVAATSAPVADGRNAGSAVTTANSWPAVGSPQAASLHAQQQQNAMGAGAGAPSARDGGPSSGRKGYADALRGPGGAAGVLHDGTADGVRESPSQFYSRVAPYPYGMQGQAVARLRSDSEADGHGQMPGMGPGYVPRVRGESVVDEMWKSAPSPPPQGHASGSGRHGHGGVSYRDRAGTGGSIGGFVGGNNMSGHAVPPSPHLVAPSPNNTFVSEMLRGLLGSPTSPGPPGGPSGTAYAQVAGRGTPGQGQGGNGHGNSGRPVSSPTPTSFIGGRPSAGASGVPPSPVPPSPVRLGSALNLSAVTLGPSSAPSSAPGSGSAGYGVGPRNTGTRARTGPGSGSGAAGSSAVDGRPLGLVRRPSDADRDDRDGRADTSSPSSPVVSSRSSNASGRPGPPGAAVAGHGAVPRDAIAQPRPVRSNGPVQLPVIAEGPAEVGSRSRSGRAEAAHASASAAAASDASAGAVRPRANGPGQRAVSPDAASTARAGQLTGRRGSVDGAHDQATQQQGGRFESHGERHRSESIASSIHGVESDNASSSASATAGQYDAPTAPAPFSSPLVLRRPVPTTGSAPFVSPAHQFAKSQTPGPLNAFGALAAGHHTTAMAQQGHVQGTRRHLEGLRGDDDETSSLPEDSDAYGQTAGPGQALTYGQEFVPGQDYGQAMAGADMGQVQQQLYYPTDDGQRQYVSQDGQALQHGGMQYSPDQLQALAAQQHAMAAGAGAGVMGQPGMQGMGLPQGMQAFLGQDGVQYVLEPGGVPVPLAMAMGMGMGMVGPGLGMGMGNGMAAMTPSPQLDLRMSPIPIPMPMPMPMGPMVPMGMSTAGPMQMPMAMASVQPQQQWMGAQQQPMQQQYPMQPQADWNGYQGQQQLPQQAYVQQPSPVPMQGQVEYVQYQQQQQQYQQQMAQQMAYMQQQQHQQQLYQQQQQAVQAQAQAQAQVQQYTTAEPNNGNSRGPSRPLSPDVTEFVPRVSTAGATAAGAGPKGTPAATVVAKAVGKQAPTAVPVPSTGVASGRPPAHDIGTVPGAGKRTKALIVPAGLPSVPPAPAQASQQTRQPAMPSSPARSAGRKSDPPLPTGLTAGASGGVAPARAHRKSDPPRPVQSSGGRAGILAGGSAAAGSAGIVSGPVPWKGTITAAQALLESSDYNGAVQLLSGLLGMHDNGKQAGHGQDGKPVAKHAAAAGGADTREACLDPSVWTLYFRALSDGHQAGLVMPKDLQAILWRAVEAVPPSAVEATLIRAMGVAAEAGLWTFVEQSVADAPRLLGFTGRAGAASPAQHHDGPVVWMAQDARGLQRVLDRACSLLARAATARSGVANAHMSKRYPGALKLLAQACPGVLMERLAGGDTGYTLTDGVLAVASRPGAQSTRDAVSAFPTWGKPLAEALLGHLIRWCPVEEQQQGSRQAHEPHGKGDHPHRWKSGLIFPGGCFTAARWLDVMLPAVPTAWLEAVRMADAVMMHRAAQQLWTILGPALQAAQVLSDLLCAAAGDGTSTEANGSVLKAVRSLQLNHNVVHGDEGTETKDWAILRLLHPADASLASQNGSATATANVAEVSASGLYEAARTLQALGTALEGAAPGHAGTPQTEVQDARQGQGSRRGGPSASGPSTATSAGPSTSPVHGLDAAPSQPAAGLPDTRILHACLYEQVPGRPAGKDRGESRIHVEAGGSYARAALWSSTVSGIATRLAALVKCATAVNASSLGVTDAEWATVRAALDSAHSALTGASSRAMVELSSHATACMHELHEAEATCDGTAAQATRIRALRLRCALHCSQAQRVAAAHNDAAQAVCKAVVDAFSRGSEVGTRPQSPTGTIAAAGPVLDLSAAMERAAAQRVHWPESAGWEPVRLVELSLAVANASLRPFALLDAARFEEVVGMHEGHTGTGVVGQGGKQASGKAALSSGGSASVVMDTAQEPACVRRYLEAVNCLATAASSSAGPAPSSSSRSARAAALDWKVWAAAAQACVRAGRPETALQLCDKAIEAMPESGRVWAASAQVQAHVSAQLLRATAGSASGTASVPPSDLSSDPLTSGLARVACVLACAKTVAPKSGEVWVEAARLHMHPLAALLTPSGEARVRFDQPSAFSVTPSGPCHADTCLTRARAFTGQYGDGYVEGMRLEATRGLLRPAQEGVEHNTSTSSGGQASMDHGSDQAFAVLEARAVASDPDYGPCWSAGCTWPGIGGRLDRPIDVLPRLRALVLEDLARPGVTGAYCAAARLANATSQEDFEEAKGELIAAVQEAVAGTAASWPDLTPVTRFACAVPAVTQLAFGQTRPLSSPAVPLTDAIQTLFGGDPLFPL